MADRILVRQTTEDGGLVYTVEEGAELITKARELRKLEALPTLVLRIKEEDMSKGSDSTETLASVAVRFVGGSWSKFHWEFVDERGNSIGEVPPPPGT